MKEKPCGIDYLATIVCPAAHPSVNLRGDLSTKRPLITEWEDGGFLLEAEHDHPSIYGKFQLPHSDPEVQVQDQGREPTVRWIES